jgi:RNA polymerase sigma-19 factor, ECF subfamily
MTEPETTASLRIARFAGQTFRKYGAELHRYLVRRLRRPQDADDLAQEVFLRVLRLKDADFVQKPQSYLYGIASHVVHEFRMRAEQENERLTFDSETLDSAVDRRSQLLLEDPVERLNLQKQLDRALERLPPTHRTVLLLLKRDGLSYDEAAKATRLSVHTVEKYLFQAKAMIKAETWDL